MLLLREDTGFLFFQSRPSLVRHRGGGTGCGPCVVSGGGQLFPCHSCWGASCFKPIASPSCYCTQLGRKIHLFGLYWHHLDINIKFSVIWFSICSLTQAADRGSAPGSPHPQRSEKHIWCGRCWGWSPVVEVNEKSDVLSADCMVCFWDDLHSSVGCCTEIPEERKDFCRTVLGGLKNVIVCLGQGVFSCLLWYGALPCS